MLPPLLWAGLAVCLLAGYAPALFGGAAVGIDDLAIDIYQQQGEFLRQNRVTEWLVQAATGLLTCQPFWPEFWAGICLALAGVLLAAALYAAAGQTPTTAGALLLAAALLAVEGAGLNRGFAADRARWQYERTLLRDAAARLDALDPGGAQPVVFTGYVVLPDDILHVVPIENRAYAVEQWMCDRWNFPVGPLCPYEEVTKSVTEWAQTAFGSHEQMYRLMEWVGRPCTRAAPDQQAAGDALAESMEPGTVTAQDGYLLVRF